MIHYLIGSRDPASHYFDVTIEIEAPNPEGQQIRLPNWIPGSYMIRDFCRNILNLRATSQNQPIGLVQLDKSSWQLATSDHPVVIEYQVYANDLSVRGAHLDHLHGYFNGTSVFFEVLGHSDDECKVTINKPSMHYCESWKLATAMPKTTGDQHQFGCFLASNYDELIDHPVEMGNFRVIEFEACGIPHEMILTGRFDCDEARLARDLTSICEEHLQFFGKPYPVDFYQFQTIVVGKGYGGLEHRASTSLMASRESLPKKGQSEITEAYRDYLGLCSHEYFHTWNVKRIKPSVYQPYQLNEEVYTELLWAFEGITSYYDDLALLRCGLIDEKSYLELLAQTVTRVLRGKGSSKQSAAESSFNTWTKFYKQDENAQNAIVSYYAKGSLIALCIDMKMRSITDNRKSLDDVMRELWKRWNANPDGEYNGVNDGEIDSIIAELSNDSWMAELADWISGTSALPIDDLIKVIGVDTVRQNALNQKDRGGKKLEKAAPIVSVGAFFEEKDGIPVVIRTEESGSSQSAGLTPGDSIIAINGLKTSLSQLEELLARSTVFDHLKVHAFRRDELYEFDLVLQAAKPTTVFFEAIEGPHSGRHSWSKSSV